MNNLINIKLLKKYIAQLLFITFLICNFNIGAQSNELLNAKKYTIDSITVSGNTSFNSQTVISFSRLRKGQEVMIPGEKISAAIRKLWGSNLFSSIDIYINKIEGNNVFLEIELIDLPELKEVKIEGQNYCKFHWSQIQQLRKEKRIAQKIKKKKEIRMSRTTMLQRKQSRELFLWELTQKQFKELKTQ